MNKLFIFSLILTPFIIGCSVNSEFPRAEVYPTTYQKKMQAAHHWDELAKIEAKNVICRLPEKLSPIYITNTTKTSNNINFQHTIKASQFKRAFRELMTSWLVKQPGVVVQLKPTSDSIIVDYDVQVLTHKDRGYQRPLGGSFAILAANMVMLYDAQYWGTPALAAIPIVAQVEWLNASKETNASPVEIIVTTKASSGNNIIMSDSHIYYVNPGDADDHYMDTEVISRRFTVVSD